MLSEGSGQTLTREATAGRGIFPGQCAMRVQSVTGRVTGLEAASQLGPFFFPPAFLCVGPMGAAPRLCTWFADKALPLSNCWQNLGPLQEVCVLSHV